MDDAGVQRAYLYGASEGGPTCVAKRSPKIGGRTDPSWPRCSHRMSMGTRFQPKHGSPVCCARLSVHLSGVRRVLAGGVIADDEQTAHLAQRLIDCDKYDEHGHRMLVRALVSMKEHTLARGAHTLWARSRAELDIEVPTFTESI